MVFPEHMEFRYYITPERKEHFALYDSTLGSRMTYLELTQASLANVSSTFTIRTSMMSIAYCPRSISWYKRRRTRPHGEAWSCHCRFAKCIRCLLRKGAERAGIGIRARSRMLTQRLSFHLPTILKPSSVMQRR